MFLIVKIFLLMLVLLRYMTALSLSSLCLSVFLLFFLIPACFMLTVVYNPLVILKILLELHFEILEI